MTKPSNQADSRRVKRRRYNPEFRAEALRLWREREADGASSSEVARELGISPSVLWQWANAPEAPAGAPNSQRRSASGETLEQEVRRLRRENAILKQEREFAKKAAAFFARESR